jgi:hypothetical protein
LGNAYETQIPEWMSGLSRRSFAYWRFIVLAVAAQEKQDHLGKIVLAAGEGR